MKKINQKLLSIPPYISTSWKNINTLHMKEIEGRPVLVIALHNGTSIDIPGLEKPLIEEIFEAHSKYVEGDTKELQIESLKTFEPSKEDVSFSFGLPFQMSGGDTSLNPSSFLEHNPSQASAPEMPKDVIQKITSITKALGMDMEQMSIPKAEPHCNCPYCQIARVIHENGESASTEVAEEEVSDEDLKFRDWDIKQEDDKLYVVSNPLNTDEHYQVYLGNPVGCTCGKKNCEHVRTVLNS
ncbi:MAG: hypothetical protein H7A38_05565 [Chlamydiales bacterium]|nr:hypothetical protein [Chlamydiales bacterium]